MNYHSIQRSLEVIAFVVALAVQIAMPVGFATVRYVDTTRDLEFKARISAGRVAKYIYANNAVWEFQATRLSETIEFPGVDHSTFRQRIESARGRVVYGDTNFLSAPVIAHGEPIVVGGKRVGTLVIETGLTWLMAQTAFVALVAFILAALSILTIYRWPMRLVDRTLANLTEQQARTEAARSELASAERQLRERTRQLIHAQELGRMGDWQLVVGEETPNLSEVAITLLRLDKCDARPSMSQLIARIQGDDGPRVAQMIEAAFRGQEVASIDVKLMRGDGTIADMAVACRSTAHEAEWVKRIDGTIQDITERKEAERQLEKLAYFDPLTGLPNRSLFQRELNRTLAHSRQTGKMAALLLIDLDKFKEVNDTLGHAIGDDLLVRVSQLISRALDNRHFVARLGGDEFGIILSGAPTRGEIEVVAHLVIAELTKPILLGRAEALIGGSIGIALMPMDGDSVDEINKNADLALYRAKDRGRGRYVFFENGMNELIQKKMVMARDLRAAATNRELEVWLQPQVDIRDNRVSGFEALMRWNHPTHGFVPPSEFIPIAESSSLICDLGKWIMRESAQLAKDWIDAGGPPYEVAVNLSAAQIWQTHVEEDVAAILAETGLPPHLLCLELTESLLVDHAEGRVRKALSALNKLGVKLALDDFGTGYSSLGYLNQLPFDKLKIDRVFVAAAPGSARARRVLQSIVGLGHALGMTVVAEGVEHQEELALLREFDCDQVQGYYFARPSPAPAAFVYAMKSIYGPSRLTAANALSSRIAAAAS